jgi:thiol-disulfide isomerase/thioredoxin
MTQHKNKINMKKALLLIPAFAIAAGFSSCKKEDSAGTDGEVISVSSRYKPVMFEYSATWCNPCGVYGYPAIHGLLEEYKHQITAVLMHPNDGIVDIEPAGMEDIIDFFGFSGTPSSAVNAGPDTYPTYLEPKITQALTANPTAKAGVGIAHKVEGNNFVVTTKTVFFEQVSGNYNLAVYMVENGIMETQSGQTGEVPFDHILRACADGKAFGVSVAANPEKGFKIDNTFTIAIPNDVRNKENLQVVAVIYKMGTDGNPTDVLNSNMY